MNDRPRSRMQVPDRVLLVWPLLVALAAVAFAFPYLNNGFTLDDRPQIEGRPELAEPSAWIQAWTAPYWPGQPEAGLYRPLTTTTFVLDANLGGLEARGFHLTNLLLHVLASIAVWFLVRRLGVHYGTAFAAAMLFATHPIHSEAVASVVGRSEILATLFGCGAWIAHLRAGESGRDRLSRARWSFLACVAFFAAFSSKESVVLLPALFWIWDRLRGGERPAARIWIGYALMFLAAMLLRSQALGGFPLPTTTIYLDNPLAFESLGVRLHTALWLQCKALWMMLWPAPLVSDYSHASIPLVHSVSDLRFVAGLALPISLIALFTVAWRKGWNVIAISIALWTLTLLPASNLLFATGTIFGERLLYLPMLAFGLAVGQLAGWALTQLGGSRQMLVGIMSLVLIVSGLGAVTSARRAPAWKSNETLALADVTSAPDSAKLQMGAGLAYNARNERELAEEAFERAVSLWDSYAQAHFNLAQLKLARSATAEAIVNLERADALTPFNPAPSKQLAGLYEAAGRLDDAARAYERGQRLDPADLSFQFNRGRFLVSAGKLDEARPVLRGLSEQASSTLQGQVAGGLLAELEGRNDDALNLYERLLTQPALAAGLRANLERRVQALSGGR